MLYSLLAFTVICIILYFLYQMVDPPSHPSTSRDLVYAVIIVLVISISALYNDYAEVTCKDHGGVLVRGAVLYSCVARVAKVRVRRSI
jgi:hypothetical protein